MKNVRVYVNRQSATRLNAHRDADKPEKNYFEKLVLTHFETRGASLILIPTLSDFSFLSYLSFWCEFLEVNQAQQVSTNIWAIIGKVCNKN